MITEDLVEFIKSQLNKNISKDLIISELSEVGWRMGDINEGFDMVKSLEEIPASSANVINTYKEPASTEENVAKEVLVEQPVIINEVKPIDLYREVPEEMKSTDTVAENTVVAEAPLQVITPITQIKENTIETPKIWTPVAIEPKVENAMLIKEEVIEVKPTFSPSNINIERFNLELNSKNESEEITNTPVIEKPKEVIPDVEFMPTINKTPFTQTTTQIPIQPIQQTQSPVEVPVKQPIVMTASDSLAQKKIEEITVTAPKKFINDFAPKNAMISSYSQDVLAATTDKKPEPTPVKIDKSKFVKLGVIILIIAFVGIMVFAFVEGYIKLPWSKFSFSVVKKDPRVIVLNSPNTISNLSSYKVDNDIIISTPSLSNITTGLASGEVVTSKETDSISIHTKGFANRVGDKLNFDYLVTLKSSILESDIQSNWKYDGSNMFISVPDLSQIIGEDAPAVDTVSVASGELASIVPEFSPEIQESIKKIDVYNMMSGEVPLYVKNQMKSSFEEFIKDVEYQEKGVENIHGVDTYHYEFTLERATSKKFLGSLVELFSMKLPSDQDKTLIGAIGSSSLDSFEVWVGKNDDNLYQIKLKLNIPLSKVLGLNDSGIAGNEVKLEWKMSYYDLGVENKITIPTNSINMEMFIKKIKDRKIKNIISSFRLPAKSFQNAIGSYGLRSNPAGSCTNPNPGSLFSPKDHKKNADGAISSISNSMNSLLFATNGLGSCYSTSKSWALAAPLFTNNDPLNPTFYCADSTGNLSTLVSPITGTICK